MPSFIVRPVEMAATRPLRQSVLRPHETLAELAAHEPADAFSAGAFERDALIAVGMIVPGGGTDADGADGEHSVWRVRGMATAPPARGRGAGSAVLAALIDHAADHGALRVWCNARTPALSLYQRAGFVIVSEEFELPQIGPHHRVELVLTRR